MYQLNSSKPARYGIMKRECTDVSKIQWFELPYHYCFHYANAWEETNTEGEDLVILWGCLTQNNVAEFKMEHPFLSENWGTKNTRLEFNLSTGLFKQEVFSPDIAIEFPQVNQNYVGYKSKYIYLPYTDKELPDTQAARDNISVSGFVKFDTELKQVIGKIDFGPIKRGGEVFFQEREGATAEDDGYLMTYIYNIETDQSEFVMWDA